MPWSEHGEEWEPAPKQRMRRVSDLDLLGKGVERVLEGGIEVFGRLIRSTIEGSSGCFDGVSGRRRPSDESGSSCKQA
jgi:hypothetical protein